MIVNAHLCACLPSGQMLRWSKTMEISNCDDFQWVKGNISKVWKRKGDKGREMSWLTIRNVSKMCTVNLWIYYGCVTQKIDDLKRTRRMLLFVSSFSQTYSSLFSCDKCVDSAFVVRLHSHDSISVSNFPKIFYWNHHGCSLWCFCFSNINESTVYDVVGFCLCVRNSPIDSNSRWWKIRWKFSLRMTDSETRQ